jgi:hypothetical protein
MLMLAKLSSIPFQPLGFVQSDAQGSQIGVGPEFRGFVQSDAQGSQIGVGPEFRGFVQSDAQGSQMGVGPELLSMTRGLLQSDAQGSQIGVGPELWGLLQSEAQGSQIGVGPELLNSTWTESFGRPAASRQAANIRIQRTKRAHLFMVRSPDSLVLRLLVNFYFVCKEARAECKPHIPDSWPVNFFRKYFCSRVLRSY